MIELAMGYVTRRNGPDASVSDLEYYVVYNHPRIFPQGCLWVLGMANAYGNEIM